MENFLKTKGLRKVWMGMYFAGLNLIALKWGVLPADDYKVVTLVLIAGFFGGNVMENRPAIKTEDKEKKA